MEPTCKLCAKCLLGATLYYDPIKQLKHLDARQITLQLLSQCMSDITSIPLFKDKWMPRKFSILGLASLLPKEIINSALDFCLLSLYFCKWLLMCSFVPSCCSMFDKTTGSLFNKAKAQISLYGMAFGYGFQIF